MDTTRIISLFETCIECKRTEDPSNEIYLNIDKDGICENCQIEVVVHGLTYPVGNPSTARGKYMRVAWEQIKEGDTYEVIGYPVERYNDLEPIPTGAILTVVSKKRDYARKDQCRYVIRLQHENIEMGWTLLALNTDIITEQLKRIK